MAVEGMTTLAVHRCRFVDFTPSAVTALAFPPLPLPSVKGKQKASSRKFSKYGTLAVGRANGNIELCEWTGTGSQIEAPQAWVCRKTLTGPYPSKVDTLAFSIRYPDLLGPDDVPGLSDLRLFSAGGGGDLVEWDLERGCIKRTISSHGGSIWTVAVNPASTLLALGCEDGSVRLLSLEHDTLTHLRRLDRVKSRILSIAWGPPVPRQITAIEKVTENDTSDDDDDDDDWTDSWLVTGCSDSSLRKWDVASGRVLDRMGTDKLRGERTLVWTVGVLGDGTIVSGDSLGMIKFWDPRTCTQLQSFQGHGADVLCLAISPEGTAVYTSGVDQKITQFIHIKPPASASSSLLSRSPARWVQTTSRRMHSHDVRALATWPPHTPLPPAFRRTFPLDIAPVLASGGLDMSVVVTPAALATSTITKVVNPLATSTVATFEEAYHRRLAYPSGPCSTSAVHLARQARLLMCMRDAGLSIWRILQKSEPELDADDASAKEGGWEMVLDMDLNVQTNLVASAISDDGRWIAVSDYYETKLFYVEHAQNGDLKPRRIRNFSSALQTHLPTAPDTTGATAFSFTPDSTKLIMATSMSSYIIVIDLGTEASPRVLRRFEHHRMKDVIVGDRVVKRKRNADQDIEMLDVDVDADGAENTAEASEGDEDEEEVPETVVATVSRMAISSDGQWLATSDDCCRTHVFNLDSIQHHCVLPSFPQPIHALAFEPAHPNTLLLGSANNSLQIYDVEARAFPKWARALTARLPQRFTHLHDPVLGVTFEPRPHASADRVALFWGATWLCKVRLDERPGYGGFDKRRRRGDGKRPPAADAQGQVQVQNFKLVTHYRPILFADFLAPGELVVVERPLVDVLAKLPPAYFKPKYGAS